MITLIFDTETTGLYNKNLPYTDRNQARIVQLACLLVDHEYNHLASFKSLIYPDGWHIHEGAQACHGISLEQCQRYGMPIDCAFEVFLYMSKRAQQIVSFNLAFDSNMMDVEANCLSIIKGRGDWSKGFCAMEAMTPIMMLPHKTARRFPGMSKYKWPTLKEAVEHVTGQPFVNGHDAMSDVIGTKLVVKWLRERKINIPA